MFHIGTPINTRTLPYTRWFLYSSKMHFSYLTKHSISGEYMHDGSVVGQYEKQKWKQVQYKAAKVIGKELD